LICATCALVLLLAATADATPRPPSNDDFEHAQAVVAPLADVFAETRGATLEAGEPDPLGVPVGASVWFEWTAERSGGAQFSSCYGIEERAVVGVYIGEAISGLTPAPRILGRRNCEYGFQAMAGVTYRVQVAAEVDPATGVAATGESELGLWRFPENDNFEDAADLGSGVNLGWGAEWGNLGATKQWGEPDHGGNAGGSSVWFTWTAPSTSEVQLSACNATFQPLLAVYAGSSLGALTTVAGGEGESGFHCNFSPLADGQLGFQAVAGTRYDIAIDGVDGAAGQFNLGLVVGEGARPPAPSPSPPLRPATSIVFRHIDHTAGSAAFRLRSSTPGSTFRCKLDRRAWTSCGAKVTYRHLAAGLRTFRADAIDPAGDRDLNPVKETFKIPRPKRRHHHG
jgi:hypothetical protein